MSFEAIVWSAVAALIVILVAGVAIWVWRADREEFPQTRHDRRDPGDRGGSDHLGAQTSSGGEMLGRS